MAVPEKKVFSARKIFLNDEWKDKSVIFQSLEVIRAG
jgi:hypothetical protein